MRFFIVISDMFCINWNFAHAPICFIMLLWKFYLAKIMQPTKKPVKNMLLKIGFLSGTEKIKYTGPF